MPFVLSVDPSDGRSINSTYSLGERIVAQFPAKCIANLGDNFGFGWMVKLCILELVDGMLVIDRVGGKMNAIACVAAE